MARISIERAFGWTGQFLRREWALVLPVALAFLALPPLAAELLIPAVGRLGSLSAATSPEAAVALLVRAAPAAVALLLCTIYASLAIIALALVPGISVREALVLALRRFPVQLGTTALVHVGLAVVAVALGIALLATGMPPAGAQRVLQPLLLAGLAVASIRLSLVAPLVVDGNAGVLTALRGGWRLTAGAGWRLAAGFAAYVLGALVLVLAVQWTLGGLLLALAQLAGQPELGRALAAVVGKCAVAAGYAVLFVLVAAFYREVVSSSGT